jgi:hypothetical protein
VVEAVILYSRTLAATQHATRLIQDVERRKRALHQTLRALRENARRAALIRFDFQGDPAMDVPPT